MSTSMSSRGDDAGAGDRLTFPILLAYALPALVISLPTIPVFIHLPTMYGVNLGLGLSATGAVLLLARLFDTVTDPLIGAASDRWPWRGQYRKPWIAVGSVVAGIGLYKVLNPPAVVDGTYLLVWLLALYGGWTMIAVPYAAWGAELSADYHERARVTAVRESCALLGIVVAGAVAAGITWTGGGERASIGAIAVTAILLGCAVIPAMLWIVPDKTIPRPRLRRSTTGRIRKDWSTLTRNGPFMRLLFAWFLNGMANGIPAGTFFLYLEYGLAAGEQSRSMFVLLYFVSAIAAIPAWLAISRVMGKHRAWCWAMVMAIAAFSTVPLIPAGGFVGFALVCVITGMALGADLALPPAIQADVVDYDTWRFGRRRTGLQFALWSMATKLSLALAVGVALPLLEILGFHPGTQDNAGRDVLIVIYALVPAVIKGAAVAMIWRFPLSPRRHALIRRRLHQTRQATIGPEEAAR